MRKIKATSPVLMGVFLAAGLILAFPAIAWGVNQLTKMALGRCWGDAVEAFSGLESDFSGEKSKKMVIGDCVGGVLIFNWDRSRSPPSEVSGLSEIIQEACKGVSASKKSYIVILPWKTLKSELDQSTLEKIKETFTKKYYTDLFKEKWSQALLSPKCIGMANEIEGSFFSIPANLIQGDKINLNEKRLEICLELSKGKAQIGNKDVVVYKIKEQPNMYCQDVGGPYSS